MILCRFLIGWYCSVGRRVGCCVGGESTVYNLYCISRIIWFIYTFLSNKKYCKYSNFKLLKWKFLQNCKKEMLRNFAKYYYTNGAKPPKLVLVTWFAFFQMVSSSFSSKMSFELDFQSVRFIFTFNSHAVGKDSGPPLS